MKHLLVNVCLALMTFASLPAQAAIKFVDSRQLWISNSGVFSGQSRATIAFKVRIESATPPSIPRTVILFSTLDRFTFELWPTTRKDTVELRANLNGASGGIALAIIPIKIGVPYTLVFAWDGPNKTQTMWVSGIPSVIGRIAGNTATGTRPIFVGPDIGATRVVPTLDDLCIWHGYAFTDADAIAYTNNVDATTLGMVATHRYRWTLSGAVGTVATLGDEGLKDSYRRGPSVYRVQEGGGTATYANPIVWKPATMAKPYVGQSGKTIVLPLSSIIDNEPVAPSKVMTVPTLSVNGTNLGPLAKPWITGKHPLVFYATPGDYQIKPDDQVRIDAPVAWCNTLAGSVEGLDHQKIDNRTGRSSVGSDVVGHTLRIGMNMNLGPTSPGLGFYWPFKNYKYRLGWPPGNRGKIQGPATLPVANITPETASTTPRTRDRPVSGWSCGTPLTPRIQPPSSSRPRRRQPPRSSSIASFPVTASAESACVAWPISSTHAHGIGEHRRRGKVFRWQVLQPVDMCSGRLGYRSRAGCPRSIRPTGTLSHLRSTTDAGGRLDTMGGLDGLRG